MPNRYRQNIPGLKPILVTGSPRSGTTWTGRMLAIAPEAYYIHEPFNPQVNIHKYGIPRIFSGYFTYISDENESRYRKPIQRLLSGEYRARYALPRARSIRDLRNVLKQGRMFRHYKAAGMVPVIKDPIALMSAAWMARTFDIHVIVMIRHPAAVIASMKRLGWGEYPGRWALPQSSLMQDLLAPYKNELEALNRRPRDPIEHNALHWKIMHHVIDHYRSTRKNWIFLRHEDIAADPVYHFSELYEKLGLTLSDQATDTIKEFSSSKNPTQSQGREKLLQLNSKATSDAWKQMLTPSEIGHIRKLVENVSCKFYTDSDWL